MSRARTAHEAAMVFDRRSLAEHETRDALEGLALDHRRMADVIERTGPPSATVASVEEAIALRRRLLAADPGSIDDRWELGYDLGELGWAYRDMSRLDEAVTAFRDSVELRGLTVSSADPVHGNLTNAARPRGGALEFRTGY